MKRVEQKAELENKINELTEYLTDNVDEIKEIGKNVLIIGGILVAGYTIVKLLGSEEEKSEKKAKNKESSVLFGMIKGAASAAIMSIAKTKIEEYISNKTKANLEKDS